MSGMTALSSSKDSTGSHGNLVSMTANILGTQDAFVKYNDSENEIQANDSQLLQAITQSQANDTSACEAQWNSSTGPHNYLYLISLPGISSQDESTYSTEYQDANAQLSSRNTTRQSQEQMFQTIIGQFPQNQQSLWQTLSSGRGIVDTESQLIGGWVKG